MAYSTVASPPLTIRSVRTGRVFLAGVVVGASLAGVVWLYTYRAHELIRFIDARGIEYHDPRRVSVQPWWAGYAALALLVFAVGTAGWLLPHGVRTVKRLGRSFAPTTDRRDSEHAHR